MFRNRTEAGDVLAERLRVFAGRDDVLILALPRGGVPVAAEVASALRVPIDVLVVRKLGVPGREELGMGAIASGDLPVLNEELVRELKIPRKAIEEAIRREQRELLRREELYRHDRPRPNVRGKIVILVDDGLATGFSMQAAVAALRRLQPSRVVVAVPVAARPACHDLGEVADQVVCVDQPEPFYSVGTWYKDFTQITDEEVRDLLDLAAGGPPRPVVRVGRTV
jgi:predicted phosphoribosyltransferase